MPWLRAALLVVFLVSVGAYDSPRSSNGLVRFIGFRWLARYFIRPPDHVAFRYGDEHWWILPVTTLLALLIISRLTSILGRDATSRYLKRRFPNFTSSDDFVDFSTWKVKHSSSVRSSTSGTKLASPGAAEFEGYLTKCEKVVDRRVSLPHVFRVGHLLYPGGGQATKAAGAFHVRVTLWIVAATLLAGSAFTAVTALRKVTPQTALATGTVALLSGWTLASLASSFDGRIRVRGVLFSSATFALNPAEWLLEVPDADFSIPASVAQELRERYSSSACQACQGRGSFSRTEYVVTGYEIVTDWSTRKNDSWDEGTFTSVPTTRQVPVQKETTSYYPCGACHGIGRVPVPDAEVAVRLRDHIHNLQGRVDCMNRDLRMVCAALREHNEVAEWLSEMIARWKTGDSAPSGEEAVVVQL